MANTNLSAERLRHLIDYFPDTGEFVWRRDHYRAKQGQPAGHIAKSGYRLIKIDQFKFQAGRLAHLWMTGEHPSFMIDHENRIRHDNRWANLREATAKQNQENKCVHKLRGVRWEEDRQKWLVRIKHHGVTMNLGRFDDLEKAIEARRQAERNLFTHSPACAPLSGSLGSFFQPGEKLSASPQDQQTLPL